LIALIDDAVEHQALADLRKLVHQLKGSAANMGANTLAAAAARFEQSDSASQADAIATLHGAWKSAEQQLGKLLGDGAVSPAIPSEREIQTPSNASSQLG
jgi:HPt (histidine-containing phosphotransfer) domain-containing protein